MKKHIFCRVAAVCFIIAAFGTQFVSAAPLKKDPPAGYATKLPDPKDEGVLIYEDFEKETGDATGRIGKLAVTVPEDNTLSAPTIEITDETSYNGKKCLKVSNRGFIRNDNNEKLPNGYNTINYENIAFDISNMFVKDPKNKNKTENYYFTAWVRNVDPNATQYFYPQLQYGGTGEVWLPDGDYYKVTGDKWTLIGGKIRDGKIYYGPFTEDITGAGIYAGRQGFTSWSCMKLITHDPFVKDQPISMTNGDFYIDDVVFWRVSDTSELVAEMPEGSDDDTLASNVTLQSSDSSGQDAAKNNADASPAGEKSNGISTAVIVAICIGAAVVIALAGILIYWVSLKKKRAVK